jgi:hypothetical protein
MAGGALLTLLLLGAPDAAATDADVANQAEQAFAAGVRLRGEPEQARAQFRKAAALFDELRRRGIDNALLARDLGNAQLLAGDLPSAILSYHRGLRLAPRDRALWSALKAARGQVLYRDDDPLGRQPKPGAWSWLRPTSGDWLLGAALAWLAVCLGVARWRMVRHVGWLVISGLALLAAMALALLGLGENARETREAARPLVVIADPQGVRLRRGPGWLTPGGEPAYPPRYLTPLGPGVEARLLQTHGDWLRIELAGGEVGWVPASAVRRDGLSDGGPTR